MSNKYTLHVALAAFSTLAAIQAGTARANLILNGDFSANASQFSAAGGLEGGITDWDKYPEGGSMIGINGKDTTYSGDPSTPFTTYGPTDQQTSPTLDWAVLDPVNGGEPPIVQTFSVTGGTSYVVSYEDAIESGDSTTGDSLVADTADGNLGANPFNESHYTAPGSTTFQPESFTFTAGSTATLETIIFQATGPDGHGAVPVDVTDVSVVAVPEPASIALLAVGAIGLLARRRAV